MAETHRSQPQPTQPSGLLPVEPEAGREPRRLARGLVLEIFAHARECYPEECCGILTGPPHAAPVAAVRCTNVQSRRRARGESELDARHAFAFDDRELHAALREAEARGHEFRAFYHSHVDAGAYLSPTDQKEALGPGGIPHYPGAALIVVSVSDGVVREAASYEWDEAGGRFRGQRLEGVD